MRETPASAGGLLVPPNPRLPDLRIVPGAALLLHEECDSERVERLVGRLGAEGILRNPPVVATLDGQAYVVLDGANRVTALRQTGVPDQLVQVVEYDDPSIVLDVWAHLLGEDGTLARREGAGALPWQEMPADVVRAGLDQGRLACAVLTESGARGLPAGGGLADRVRLLAGVVTGYKERTPIYRVQAGDLGGLAREFGRAAALVLFPRFSKQDIRAIARLSVKLPTGISRHVIPHRALRVNVDLALLRAPEPVSVKQDRLDELIRGRLLEHRVRHYPESTVLYDE